MFKFLIILTALLPIGAFAQVTITGRVLNRADAKPIANASVFLGNASVGGKTDADGAFALHNAKPGKYDLIISVLGFEAYSQTISINNSDINLADISISPKTIALSEVKVVSKTDPNRERNYNWFLDEFLGRSEFAADCKILNPELLDLDYDETKHLLTASSVDFLVIENAALGYRIKYLLTDFKFDNEDDNSGKIHYEGSALFEEMKGTAAQQKRWQKRRQQVYEGSEMHFLRSALNNELTDEGFRVAQLAVYANPERPADSLITAKINRYKKLNARGSDPQDSLSYWNKKSKLPKILQNLEQFPLDKDDIIKPTNQQGMFALGCDYDELYVTYNKGHHFNLTKQPAFLNDARNTENTLLNFSVPYAYFDKNGGVINPNSIAISGVWGRGRIAGLLPLDYEPPHNNASLQDEYMAMDSVISKLTNYNALHINEKTYLQFDKPYYTAGDTIYFKAYVTTGENHQLSDISAVLHVDLINTNSKVDQSIKLELVNGVAWGDFALPDSLPKGGYRVRAYTRLMRNYGDGAYFDQTIPVGSLAANKVPESGGPRNTTAANAKPDLQFFPEGGQLVTGIRSKIAFKAISGNGTGIDFTGIVTDNDNKEVATIASAHLGMGSFYLNPQPGKTYKANLKYADGTQTKADLPKAADNGLIMNINNDSIPKASVRIEASKAHYLENKDKDYTLLIYSGGIATTVNCTLDSAVITMDILKRRLHTGIATVTLFSPTGEPLCERLMFVQNYDQPNLAVNSDKASYAKRGKVNIRLNVKNRADEPSQGHFSVSVVNENLVQESENDENTILTHLLLTSDLKGFVEQPNYYFADINPKTQADLDLVMLTHGYRRFEWKQVLSNEKAQLAFEPEKGLEIAGTATNLFNSPVNKGTVTLIAEPKGSFLSTVTDSKGQFSFSDLLFTDTSKFILQAVNAKGKNNTRVVYNKDIPLPVVPAARGNGGDANIAQSAYIENNKQQQAVITQYGAITGKMLKEVAVNDKKIRHYEAKGNLISPEFTDQLITSEDLENAGQRRLSEILAEKFHGQATHAGLIVVDGLRMPRDFDINLLNASEIETVGAVWTGNEAIYGANAGNGVWLITTKNGKGIEAKDIASVGILPISPKGFHKAREFYSPKYDAQNITNSRPDLRSTIYWKPELITDKDGNTSFEYYNADGSGTYQVTIEGIDDKGNLGRQIYSYKVE